MRVFHARRRGIPRTHFTISKGGERLTTWTPPHKGGEGGFVVDGVAYSVEIGPMSTTAVLSVVDGPPVAVAEGLGRTPWFVRTGDGWSHRFERTLDRWFDQLVVAGGQQVGVVRRTGRSQQHVEADLPGISDPVAVFVVAVVVTMWDQVDADRATRR